MSADSWTSILLSIVTIALTVLAIMIGVAAVWGYGQIRDEARRTATEVAKSKAREFFSGQGISEGLRAEITRLVHDEIELAREAQGIATAYAGTEGETSGTDSSLKEYPNGEGR